MPKNAVQFQRGMGLQEFRHRYGTAAQCEQALFAWRWPRGFVCPECGHTGYCTLKGRRLIQCNSCRRQTSVTAGTIFAGSKLAYSRKYPPIVGAKKITSENRIRNTPTPIRSLTV